MTSEGDDPADVLNLSIEEIGLSVRSTNCLRAARMKTVGDLLTYSPERLLRLPAFGRTSLEDVEAALRDLGLTLAAQPSTLTQQSRTSSFPRPETGRLTDWQKGLLTMPVDALRLGTRTRQVAEKIGDGSIGAVVAQTESVLMRLDNFGRRSVVELRAKLASFGLGLGMNLGAEWSQQRAEWASLHGAAARQHLEERFEAEFVALCGPASDLGTRLWATTRLCLDEPSPDLLTRNVELLGHFHGWDGSEPCTLEATGQAYGLTRERVRQLSRKLERGLRRLDFVPSWLTDAIAAAEAAAPCQVEEAPALLAECGVNLGTCDVRGILRAAEMFGTKLDLTVPRSGRMSGVLCTPRQARLGERTLVRARRLTGRYGCFSTDTLMARLDPSGVDALELKRLLPLISTHSDIVWLDARREWGFVPEVGRSRLFGAIRKTLSVADSVGIDEIRSAVRRNRHMEGFAPRRDVLLAILRHVPWATVEETRVRGVGLDPAVEVVGNDRMFYEVLAAAGGALDRYTLVERCTRRGMNVISCNLLLNYSPVVTPLTPQVFALAGTDVAPGTVERLTPVRASGRVLQDYGWAPDGRLWVVVQASQSTIANGLINIPQAFAEYLQGRFQIDSAIRPEDGEDDADAEDAEEAPVTIKVSRLMLSGLRPALIERAAEVGDRILLIFDRERRTLELRIGDEGVAAEFV